ncbi:MAG: hypothetical protein JW889_03000 [Verrucomicrobia bacterium]|nr:hypothetical protein [Verrucomicrobiota bacterium]
MSRTMLTPTLALLLLLPVGACAAGLDDLFGTGTVPKEPVLGFEFTASHTTLRPATPLLVAITTTIPEDYHLLDQIYLRLDDGGPFAPERSWHTPYKVRKIGPNEYAEFVGDLLVVYELAADEGAAPGPHDLTLIFEYSPCHEELCFGLREARATIPITVGSTATANPAFEPFRAQLPALTAVVAREGADALPKTAGENRRYVEQFDLIGKPNVVFLDAEGRELNRIVGYRGRRVFLEEVGKVAEGQVVQQTRRSLALWIGLALVGGLLAAFSPCVYPMIPITMGYLADQAGHQFRRNLMLVIALGAGVLLPFALIGAFIGALKDTLYSLTSNTAYVIALDVILIALTASMLGAFEIQLPAALRNTAAAGRNTVGAIGAFIIGLVVVPLAFACTAPALGLIIPFIVGQSVGAAMLIMIVFGLGLALPFLAAGIFTGAISAMPRAGAWMLGIKKVLALLLLGVIFYVSRPLTADFPHTTGVIAGTVFIAVAVSLGVFRKKLASVFDRAVAVIALVLGLNLVVGSALVKADQIPGFPLQTIVAYPRLDESAIDWRSSLDKALAEAKRDDKLVMAYFWGYNCIACTEYTAYVWSSRETADALTGFVPVKINIDE